MGARLAKLVTAFAIALAGAVQAPSQAQAAETSFTFTGHGYGHGRGMSQYGAQGAALRGLNARQILAMKDPNLDTLLRRIWGEVRETAADRQQQLQQWRERLQPDQISSADASKGRLLFVQACSACHRLYGEGGQIGPELTGSDRHNLDYLLGNIIDPSSVVPADYRTTVFHLKDGRTLTGVVPERTERTTTVQTPTERLTLENSQITQQEQLPVSLMPDQLLELLGEENARHLFAYLMSRAQVPLPVAE